MKKMLCLIGVLVATAAAQQMPSPMPTQTRQYGVAQQVIAAVNGFESRCEKPSERLAEVLQGVFKVYQTVCGGYFVSAKPPLAAVDLALSAHEAVSAWQRTDGDIYSRNYKFAVGELRVELIDYEYSTGAVIVVTYQEAKPETSRTPN